MRWSLIALVVGLIPALAAAEPNFPYKAAVTTDEVYVRSGPGENYYPTDKLKAGDEVEVYRHDPGGWYAIRPPKGSFSWVSGKHLQIDKDNLGTVTEDRVASRVGSRFSDVRDVVQVRLHRGEVVDVLDARRTGPASAMQSNTWYKIAPPAGEFRWISGRYLDSQYARDGLRRNAPGVVARVPGEPLAGLQDPGPPIPRRLSAEQYQTALNDLDLEISTMVVEEPTVWDFGELRQRAESLYNQAETAVERGRARTIVSKIARFEDIKAGYDKVATMKQEMARSDRQSGRLYHSTLPASDPSGRYDAVGQLTTVQSPKPGAPQYAVLDPDGNVRAYVSPARRVCRATWAGRWASTAFAATCPSST